MIATRMRFLKGDANALKSFALASLVAGASAACASDNVSACSIDPEQTLARYRDFAVTLLADRQPRKAYEQFASPEMDQRNRDFGKTRESTILQWEKLMAKGTSNFSIESVKFSGEQGDIWFIGHLESPIEGAEISLHSQIKCGVIVAEWAELHPISAK